MEVNAGQQHVQSVTVPGRPDEVIQQLTNGLSGVPGYTMTATGPNSLALTRKFLPQWALIVAIVGALACLIGLLALLVKEEENLTITAAPADGGTRLDIAGAASAAMRNRLTGIIASLGGQVAAAPAIAPGFTAPPRPVAPAPAATAATPAPPPPPGAALSTPGGPAAWHPDPSGRHEQRFWDGSGWTEHVSDAGTPGTDPPPA